MCSNSSSYAAQMRRYHIFSTSLLTTPSLPSYLLFSLSSQLLSTTLHFTPLYCPPIFFISPSSAPLLSLPLYYSPLSSPPLLYTSLLYSTPLLYTSLVYSPLHSFILTRTLQFATKKLELGEFRVISISDESFGTVERALRSVCVWALQDEDVSELLLSNLPLLLSLGRHIAVDEASELGVGQKSEGGASKASKGGSADSQYSQYSPIDECALIDTALTWLHETFQFDNTQHIDSDVIKICSRLTYPELRTLVRKLMNLIILSSQDLLRIIRKLQSEYGEDINGDQNSKVHCSCRALVDSSEVVSVLLNVCRRLHAMHAVDDSDDNPFIYSSRAKSVHSAILLALTNSDNIGSKFPLLFDVLEALNTLIIS